MSWPIALALMMALVCLPLFAGLPVALAFFLANVVGTWLFMGGMAGLSVMPMEYVFAIGKFSLVPIILFVLMGEILLHTGVAYRAINAIDKLISRVPGRMAVVSIAGGTVFSSLSGSTIANTAILGSVLLPDMVKRGYDPRFANGPHYGSGRHCDAHSTVGIGGATGEPGRILNQRSADGGHCAGGVDGAALSRLRRCQSSDITIVGAR